MGGRDSVVSCLAADSISLSQLSTSDFLHFIDRDRPVHVHGGLVGLMPQEILDPLGRKPLRFEVPRDGVAEDMRIELTFRTH